MPLVESGQDRVGKDYSKAAYELFPRYRLDEAIRIEVEKSTAQQFRSLEEARTLLLESARRALSSMLQQFQRSPEACVALTDEWKAFEAYISSVDAVQLARIETLPYRRILSQTESKQLRQELSARWGPKGYWYPLSKCDPRTNVVAFHQELWEQRNGTSLLLQAAQERAMESWASETSRSALSGAVNCSPHAVHLGLANQ